ncbi:hypothetical protein OG21DRAFT_1512328 [Imleria badia]|nr:hypothetical protein OG21DRAFT_1512328 [Imleria badia]
MGVNLNPGCSPGQAECSTRRLDSENNSLRTLVYALLLAACCLYLFKLSNKRRKPLEVIAKPTRRQHTVSIEGTASHDGAPAHVPEGRYRP